MTDQPLFNDEPPEQRAFYEWAKLNPDVINLALKFAREARRSGRQRYSIKTIVERIRWHTTVETRGDDFKINNNHAGYLVRLLIRLDPSLDGFFELRAMKYERRNKAA